MVDDERPARIGFNERAWPHRDAGCRAWRPAWPQLGRWIKRSKQAGNAKRTTLR
jgi:hypothetical protein